MPEYLTPGVYREERSGPRPIEGVGTAVAAFIGFAPAGPANKPVLITSWQQYIEKFGKNEGGRKNPHHPGTYLSHAVEGYFLNGGGRCYVTRVLPPGAGDTATASTVIAGRSGKPLLTVTARETPTEDIQIQLVAVPQQMGSGVPGSYTLRVTPLDVQGNPDGAQKPETKSRFTEAASIDTINQNSSYITIKETPQFAGLTAEQREPRAARSRTTAKGEVLIYNRVAKGVALYTISLKPGAPSVGVEVIEDQAPIFPPPVEPRFNLAISVGQGRDAIPEEILNVGLGLRNNIEEVVRRKSKLVTVAVGEQAATGDVPVTGTFAIEAPKPVGVPVQVDHFKGDRREQSGINGLAIAEEATMVCCPDLMAAVQQGWLDDLQAKAVQLAMINHCEDVYRRDRIAILDSLPGQDVQQVLEWRTQIANYDSAFAAFYYPWITITGPDGKLMNVPPCGHIAGIYARNDRERGVHKAPANEIVRGVIELESQVSHEDQAMLNPEGINCIRAFPGRGIRVWGGRTLSSDPQWRYINVRRLFNFVEKSIERNTQWVVFEPNNPDLWARVKRDVTAFLTTVWRSGALFGPNPAESFQVICDESNNPSEERDMGRLYIDIGLAAVKPAEFVIFRFQQITGGGE